MKIAIHHRENSFSERWISYCKENTIEYKIVSAYSNTIIQDIEGCAIFMWHYHHAIEADVLLANNLIHAIELSGLVVFPNIRTSWFFDDKIAQKYLLESIQAPFINTTVFYSKKEASSWSESTTFPKVFKLTRGAGASNVQLVKSRKNARKKIKKAFGSGFSQFNKGEYFKSQYKKGLANKRIVREMSKAFYFSLFSTSYS